MTFAPDIALPARGRMLLYVPGGDLGEATEAARRWGAPDSGVARVTLAVPRPSGPELVPVDVRAVSLVDALPWLLAAGSDPGTPWRPTPDTLRVWGLAACLALRLVASHRILPLLVGNGDGGVVATWRSLPDDEADAVAALARLASALPRAGHAVACGDTAVWAPDALLSAFLDAVADACARAEATPSRPGRPRARLLPWTARWAEAAADAVDPSVPLRESEAGELLAGIAEWERALVSEGRGVAELHLQGPDDDEGPWKLAFGVRADDGRLVGADAVWAADGADATALQEVLLGALARAARVFPPFEAVLRTAAPQELGLDLEEAWRFAAEAAPVLSRAGMVVVLPAGLEEQALRLRLRIGTDDGDAEADLEGLDGLVDTDGRGGGEDDLAFDGGMVGYAWEIALGDEVLDGDDLDRLLDATAPLVRWRDGWVRVDPAALAEMRELREWHRRSGKLTLSDALLFSLAGAAPADALDGVRVRSADVEVVAAGTLSRLLDRLRAASERPPPPTTPEGFVGELRPYQRRGVAWLRGMAELGFGAVLADAMGLGKTIQLIAHLLHRGPSGRYLVICPTSVVGNWEREFARFAPSIPVTRFHGPERPLSLAGVEGAVVTSYGMLRRDVETLAAVEWDVVALDEAQFVKNPTTAGARAVRRLRSAQRIALTGTPLENRLVELWALLDATNPGLLGTRSGFVRRFVTAVEKRQDPRAAERLRRLVAPFVLRRTKDDPAVAAELPEKIERTVLCALTPEQASLYRTAVESVLGGGGLEAASRMERRGRILALLTTLKQICNHPAQHLRERERGAVALGGRSGKLAAAREIVGEAVGAGEQVLLFTQYVEMGHLLVAQLSQDLDTAVPFLHGSVPATARDRMVAAFQGERGDERAPVLVVSLRAGGTGLNLTAATHVLHYDRWWNPAVEDQATDRAHRIGQTSTVEVHKLVTAGTVEERIDALLERKRALAEAVVGAGEAWLTELGDDELAELVALSGQAVTDLDDEEPPALAGRVSR